MVGKNSRSELLGVVWTTHGVLDDDHTDDPQYKIEHLVLRGLVGTSLSQCG